MTVFVVTGLVRWIEVQTAHSKRYNLICSSNQKSVTTSIKPHAGQVRFSTSALQERAHKAIRLHSTYGPPKTVNDVLSCIPNEHAAQASSCHRAHHDQVGPKRLAFFMNNCLRRPAYEARD